MSRSRRKNPIVPIGNGKMKWWKKRVNKALRQKPIDGEIPDKREWDIWGSPSDGKWYLKDIDEKYMRK